MKKSPLNKIIKESIKKLLIEQQGGSGGCTGVNCPSGMSCNELYTNNFGSILFQTLANHHNNVMASGAQLFGTTFLQAYASNNEHLLVDAFINMAPAGSNTQYGTYEDAAESLMDNMQSILIQGGQSMGWVSGIYDDFVNGNNQTINEKLCNVRKTFEQYNLISGLHTFLSQKDNSYENILPTLSLLSENDKKKLFDDLEKLDFNINKLKVA